MCKLLALSVGVSLCGLSLACSGGRTVLAKQDGLQTRRMGSVAVRAAGDPVRPEWTVASPVSFKNLTIVPVTSYDYEVTDQFITLDQGLQSGTVTITELGADGRAHSLRPGDQANDDAEVNTLSITNRSGKLLVLIAGEILMGGKQDRIVGSDRIVKPDNAPAPLDVFCVEHGRWSGGAAFGQSRIATASDGGTTNGSRGGGSLGSTRALEAEGAGNIATRNGPSEPGMVSSTPSAMALPSVRESAEAGKSQSQVWAKVAQTAETVDVTSSTSALVEVYEDKRVIKDVDQYTGALRHELAGKNIVGVVVIVNGRPVSTDVFASPSLFQNYWPKLLQSYALEAVTEAVTHDKGASNEGEASAGLFLSRVKGRSSSEGLDGLYRLTEHQSGDDSSFELEYTVMSPPLLVHFNRVVGK